MLAKVTTAICVTDAQRGDVLHERPSGSVRDYSTFTGVHVGGYGWPVVMSRRMWRASGDGQRVLMPWVAGGAVLARFVFFVCMLTCGVVC